MGGQYSCTIEINAKLELNQFFFADVTDFTQSIQPFFKGKLKTVPFVCWLKDIESIMRYISFSVAALLITIIYGCQIVINKSKQILTRRTVRGRLGLH